MNSRERLVSLIDEAMERGGRGRKISEAIADHLIDGGVIVPPCRFGDTIYNVICAYKKYGVKVYVKRYQLTRHSFWHAIDYFGEKVFLTRKAADAAMNSILDAEKRRSDDESNRSQR